MSSRTVSHSTPLELVVFVWGGPPQRYVLPSSGQLRIGRKRETNDIAINDSSVSRQHAILHINGKLHVQDLGTPNGTFIRKGNKEMDCTTTIVEQQHCDQSFVVDPGDRIFIGRVPALLQKPRSTQDRLEAKEFKRPIVCDPSMVALYAEAREFAQLHAKAIVLILGETGAGKEELADTIHRESVRAHKKLVTVNCAHLPEDLFESELFGHVRGAFTGAVSDKPGLIEDAEGGTLFLDEIGELSMTGQAKLLRVLEDRQYRRRGHPRLHTADVRIIAATNRDLQQQIADGAFRDDLYYRLHQFVLEIPPLRKRRSEIIPIAEALIARASAKFGVEQVPHLSAEAKSMLLSFSFPGNVRQLKNIVEHAAVVCRGEEILPEHLPAYFWKALGKTPADTSATMPVPTHSTEQERMLRALEECGNNITRAAAMVGMPLRTFIYKLDRIPGVRRSRKRPAPM